MFKRKKENIQIDNIEDKMTKILLKALAGLKGKGFYIFLAGIVIFAVCFHTNNPTGGIAALEEQEQEQEQKNEHEQEQEHAQLIDGAISTEQLSAAVSTTQRNIPKPMPDKKLPVYYNDFEIVTTSETVPEETTTEQTTEEITTTEPVTEPPETDPPETDPPETVPPETAAPEPEVTEYEEPIISSYGQREQYQWEIDYANELFDMVNNLRAEYGLSPLKKLDALTAAATERAWEITIYRSHTRPDGTSCFTALTEHGLPLSKRSENISYYQTTPQAALNSFMSNYAHSSPILSEKFEYLGVGFYYIENDPTGAHYYWTQMFYAP